jgi:hypothetical protein
MTPNPRIIAVRSTAMSLALILAFLVAPLPAVDAETQPCQPISAPVNISAIADGEMIRFTWDVVPGASEYLTWWDTHEPGWSANAATNSQMVPQELGRGSILFEVTARGTCGQSPWSIKFVPSHVPFTPIDVRTYPGRRSMTASWSEAGPSSNSILSDLHYRVTTEPGGRSCEAISPTCTVTGLTTGKAYTASVIAYNVLGQTQSTLTAPTLIVVGPSVPLSVKVSTGLTTALVSWKPPKFDGGRPVSRYQVTVEPGKRICTTTGVTCRVTGLSSGTSYRFVVVADNGRALGSPALSRPTITKAPPTSPLPSPDAKPAAPIN